MRIEMTHVDGQLERVRAFAQGNAAAIFANGYPSAGTQPAFIALHTDQVTMYLTPAQARDAVAALTRAIAQADADPDQLKLAGAA